MILVFGILGWVFTCPVFSTMAWIMGTSDLREMRNGRMDPSGMGQTQAGLYIAVAQLILCALVAVGFMLLLAAGAAAN